MPSLAAGIYTSAAPVSTTKCYLSRRTARAAGDPEIGGRSVPALGLNASSSASTMLTIPGGTVSGSYSIIADSDGAGEVAELTETNNTRSKAITVSP